MKTLWQRLYWALVGYRARPWPAEPPLAEAASPPEVAPASPSAQLPDPFTHNLAPGGVVGPREPPGDPGVFGRSAGQDDHLRGSLKLAVDLLAPHFQSEFDAHRQYLPTPASMLPEIAFTGYVAPSGTKEQIDILASGAAWLAKDERLTKAQTIQVFMGAVDDVYPR